MSDNFANRPYNIESPAREGQAADISSTNHTFTRVTRGVYVGTAGNLILVLAGGQSLTFANVPAGTLLPVCAASVTRSGTTAGSIVGLW